MMLLLRLQKKLGLVFLLTNLETLNQSFLEKSWKAWLEELLASFARHKIVYLFSDVEQCITAVE